MKDRIITIVALVALILTIILMLQGIKIGSLEIYSIKELINKNEDVNSGIEEVAVLTTTNYPVAISNLEDTNELLEEEKEKYYELVDLSSEDGKLIYEAEEYDIGYLWTIIGRCATENELNLGMEISKSGEYYNLNFTLKGSYNDISNFISDIENNSELQFRIHSFKLVPGEQISGEEDTRRLQANFVVRDISIKEETLSGANIKTNSSNIQSIMNNNTSTK